jgi:hypothetical protein
MKYAVIMYNFNNYEIMREIPDFAVNKDIEYIYVTDNDKLTSKNWKIVIDHDLEGLSPFDKCYSVRFNLFKYTNAEIVLYADGSIQILNDIMPYFKKFEESKKDLGVMVHPERNTVFDEYKKWIEIRNYPKYTAMKCLAEMELNDYDVKNYKGLYQGGLRFIRNKNKNIQLDTECFNLLKKLGENGKIERLDQTVYSYLLNTKFSDIDCFVFSDSFIYSKLMNIQGHNCPFRYYAQPNRPFIHKGYFRNNLINLIEWI